MVITPLCYERGCKNFTGIWQPKKDESQEIPICTAFPRGIPSEILQGTNEHLVPIQGQGNNIVFERR
jgi:hypothetical protein